MLHDLQRSFRSAVLSAGDGALAGRVAAPHGPIAARVDVYRTTVQTGLIDVLAAAFPVVQRIVGADYFAGLARAFVTAAPPRAPQLSAYGGGLAAFIAGCADDHRLPYLADVARLEWARGESYFAADAALLDPATLIAGDVGELHLALHPAARLVRADFPIMTIWTANQVENTDVPRIDMAAGEAALASRPGMTVVTRRISPGDAALIEALGTGASLGAAAATAFACETDFDLRTALELHLRHGTFAGRA
jgi:hypothetical protein